MSDAPGLELMRLVIDRLGAIEAGIARLSTGQDSLRSDFNRLSDRQDQLRIDLMARMDRLQDSITGIREDVSVIAGITDTVRRTSDNTRDEMRLTTDTVTILEKRVRNLMQQVRELRGDP